MHIFNLLRAIVFTHHKDKSRLMGHDQSRDVLSVITCPAMEFLKDIEVPQKSLPISASPAKVLIVSRTSR